MTDEPEKKRRGLEWVERPRIVPETHSGLAFLIGLFLVISGLALCAAVLPPGEGLGAGAVIVAASSGAFAILLWCLRAILLKLERLIQQGQGGPH
jgi:hypothetical protein